MLKRILCIFLSLLMLISTTACNIGEVGRDEGNGENNITDNTGGDAHTQDANTSPYVIIVPEECSEGVRAAAVSLQSEILKETGYKLEVNTDYVSWSDTPNEYEILIGEVDREEIKADADIKLNDYVVRTIGKKWIVFGGGENATLRAISYFKDNCISSLFDVPENFKYYCEGQYSVENFTLCGKDISEYIMVYPSNSPICLKYAERIQGKIAELCGVKVPIYIETKAPESGGRINFGDTATSGCDLTTVGYDSYEISASEGNVSVIGGTSYGYNSALKIFERELVAQKTLNISCETLTFEFDQVSRNEYIANADLFVPIWKETLNLKITRTFDEKIAVFSDANTNKLFAMAHRGEHEYYPEGSVESVISAYLMGADGVELDVRFTKDGVPVILHNATLTKLTNYSEMQGKTVNGITLPNVPELSEWTYEQVMQLNLKMGGVVTEYKIASLKDMLVVSKDRIFLYLDNKDQREDILDVVYQLMKETGNYRSVFIGGTGAGFLKENCVALQQKIKNEVGQTALIYVRASSATANSTVSYLKNNAVGPYAILLNGGYTRKDKIGSKTVMENHGSNLNFGTWLTDDNDLESEPAIWQEIYDLGFRILFVDTLDDLIKYKNQKKY